MGITGGAASARIHTQAQARTQEDKIAFKHTNCASPSSDPEATAPAVVVVFQRSFRRNVIRNVVCCMTATKDPLGCTNFRRRSFQLSVHCTTPTESGSNPLGVFVILRLLLWVYAN